MRNFAGFGDQFADDPALSGRICESCPVDFCSNRGVCSVQDGQRVCECTGKTKLQVECIDEKIYSFREYTYTYLSLHPAGYPVYDNIQNFGNFYRDKCEVDEDIICISTFPLVVSVFGRISGI